MKQENSGQLLLLLDVGWSLQTMLETVGMAHVQELSVFMVLRGDQMGYLAAAAAGTVLDEGTSTTQWPLFEAL